MVLWQSHRVQLTSVSWDGFQPDLFQGTLQAPRSRAKALHPRPSCRRPPVPGHGRGHKNSREASRAVDTEGTQIGHGTQTGHRRDTDRKCVHMCSRVSMAGTKWCLCSRRTLLCMFVRARAAVHVQRAPACMYSGAHVRVAARVCGVRRRACVLARMCVCVRACACACVCVCAGVHVRVAARVCVRVRSHQLQQRHH